MARASIRFRLLLPIVFGFLAAMLMLWDYENNRMIALMGMGWDMGPPFWPYQAIYLLLFTINAPAFVLSIPFLKLLNLQTLYLQYSVWLPAIVCWWWWLGTRIDFRDHWPPPLPSSESVCWCPCHSESRAHLCRGSRLTRRSSLVDGICSWLFALP